MERMNRRTVAAVIAVAGLGVAIGGAFAQTSAVDEIAKYRAALQDGNPAELWEARGEELWTKPHGRLRSHAATSASAPVSSKARTRNCRVIFPMRIA